jgi:hypothetical protein
MRIGSLSCSWSILDEDAVMIRFSSTLAAQPARSLYNYAGTGRAALFGYME